MAYQRAFLFHLLSDSVIKKDLIEFGFLFLDSVIKKNLIEFGFSGWMADFGEYLPVDGVYYDGTDPMLMHNYFTVL